MNDISRLQASNVIESRPLNSCVCVCVCMCVCVCNVMESLLKNIFIFAFGLLLSKTSEYLSSNCSIS